MRCPKIGFSPLKMKSQKFLKMILEVENRFEPQIYFCISTRIYWTDMFQVICSRFGPILKFWYFFGKFFYVNIFLCQKIFKVENFKIGKTYFYLVSWCLEPFATIKKFMYINVYRLPEKAKIYIYINIH